MLRYVVFLKGGTFDVAACDEEEIFPLARSKNAGICGVFDNLVTAEMFVTSLIPIFRRSSIINAAKRAKDPSRLEF